MVRRSGDRPAAASWRDAFEARLVAIEQFLDPGGAAGPSSGPVRSPIDQVRDDIQAMVKESETKMNSVIRLNGEVFKKQREEAEARITAMEVAAGFARQREKQVSKRLQKALGACDDFRTLEDSICAMFEKRMDELDRSLTHNKALAEQMEGVASTTELRRVAQNCDAAHQRITALQQQRFMVQGPRSSDGESLYVDVFALTRRVDEIAQELHSLARKVIDESDRRRHAPTEFLDEDSVERSIDVAQAAASALRGRGRSRGRTGGSTPSSRCSSADSSVRRMWHARLRGDLPDHSGPES